MAASKVISAIETHQQEAHLLIHISGAYVDGDEYQRHVIIPDPPADTPDVEGWLMEHAHRHIGMGKPDVRGLHEMLVVQAVNPAHIGESTSCEG